MLHSSSSLAQYFGHLADKTGGFFGDEQALEAGHAIDQAEADIAAVAAAGLSWSEEQGD